MRVGHSLTFVTRQPDGLKRHLFGTLLLLVPVVGWIPAAGYPIRLLGRVREGEEELPPWERWGDLIVKGLVFWLAWFTYNLPLLIFNRLSGDFGLISPASLWSVIVFLVLPAGLVRYVESGRPVTLYHPGPVLDFIRENLGHYLTAWIVSLAAFSFAFAGMAATLQLAADMGGGIGLVAVVLVSFVVFWAALSSAHLFGSVARDGDLHPSLRP